MARGIRGSAKDKAKVKQILDVVKETKFRGPGSISRDESESESNVYYDNDDYEDESPSAGVEAGVSEKPEPVILKEDSVASQIFPEDTATVNSSENTSFKFKKVPSGGSNVIVEILRSDGRETTQTFPNQNRADEFIAMMQKRISDAREERERIAQENGTSPFVQKYGNGIVVCASGEMVITAKTKEQTVVIAELVEIVSKFLAGREVDAFRVSEQGLILVAGGQKATFLWNGNKAMMFV
jgi:hypothetical protein